MGTGLLDMIREEKDEGKMSSLLSFLVFGVQPILRHMVCVLYIWCVCVSFCLLDF